MSFDMFDVSASGMHAQRIKMDTVSSNIANANTTRNANGEKEVYKKKEVAFQAVYKGKLGEHTFPHGSVQPVMDIQDGPYLRGGVSTSNEGLSQGVEVARIQESKTPYRKVYDPTHPDADAEGFLTLPNINVVEEMVNMVNASKAYEANAAIANTAKTMIQAALGI